ncbi:MAG TPA: YdcF family protein [Ferrovibrio sp.]|uniref:YdcF family protein n=1 Tax=Ferrovibrio sp. TaxID=1917215 RepID=UPI002ED66E15
MARRTRTTTPLTKRIRRWLAAVLVLVLLWLGGALVYFEQVESIPDPGDQRTDAIVVLTGGAARLPTALRLLNENKAERLLITGVSPTANRASLMQAVLPSMPDAAQASTNWEGIDLQLLFECCVDLGFEAADTAGNAVEASNWVSQHHFRSIRLVTANYHMLRSLAEFHRRLPAVTIIAHPVRSDSMRVEDWWRHSANAMFLLGEYSKYVAALARARLDHLIAVALGNDDQPPVREEMPMREDIPGRKELQGASK